MNLCDMDYQKSIPVDLFGSSRLSGHVHDILIHAVYMYVVDFPHI